MHRELSRIETSLGLQMINAGTSATTASPEPGANSRSTTDTNGLEALTLALFLADAKGYSSKVSDRGSNRLENAFVRIDAINARDPQGRAEAYGAQMSQMLERVAPDAGEALRVAVRAQHIERWVKARQEFPEGRAGYLKWRAELAAHHEAMVRSALADLYPRDMLGRIGDLVRKRGLGRDPETQCLEDCACLVFLEHELDAFAERHPEEKVIAVLQKTWRKMSSRAQALAQSSPRSARSADLLRRALHPSG